MEKDDENDDENCSNRFEKIITDDGIECWWAPNIGKTIISKFSIKKS